MKNNIYKHSFARRLTQWLMLVLLIMMAGLAYLIFQAVKMSMVEVVAVNFHDNMELSEKNICDALSDVSVAVENNIFYIERHIGQPAEMQAVMERIVAQNPRIRSCGISFIENYFPQKGRSFCPYAWRKDSLQVEGRAPKRLIWSRIGSRRLSQPIRPIGRNRFSTVVTIRPR